MKTRIQLAMAAVALVLASGPARAVAQEQRPGLALIPAGQFEMGDHHGFVDPKHGSDEIPIHPVRLDAFCIGINDVTTREYCEFLNSALARKQIEARKGAVYLAGGSDLLCDTRGSSPGSRIGWDGHSFSVLDRKEDHPMVCVRWPGAVVYCNWLSAQKGVPPCYDTATWDCDFNKSGYRLPTEAEWEYAARGGQYNPYWNFPWANEADATKANWPESKNPYRSGPLPWTTPVGFFDGKLHKKADLGWPGPQEVFQAANGANGFGLYDMAGNVWQWCTEWYERSYYAYAPATNPPGPAAGSPMPDGKPYRCMRGGSWFNGEYGHSRVSNRDPSYFRGPDPITHQTDPDGPYFHISFRVVLPVKAESRPVLKPTPVRRVERNEAGRGGGRAESSGGGGQRPKDQARSGEERPPRDGQSGVGAAGGIRLLPPRALEQLKLTAGQQKQIADLETEAKAKLDKILTPDQQQQLQQMRPPQRQSGNDGGNINPAPNQDNRSPRPEATSPTRTEGSGAAVGGPKSGFVLRSPEVADGGMLPQDYTGDGTSATLPLEWSGAPAGTRSYAVIMHHIPAPGATPKWYWVLYNIPPTVQSLPRNVQNIGILGNNSINDRTGYAPPHSKGPGPKTYILTVYALSAAPQLAVPPAQVSREVLLAAMQDHILATAELHVVYSRPEGATSQGAARGAGGAPVPRGGA